MMYGARSEVKNRMPSTKRELSGQVGANSKSYCSPGGLKLARKVPLRTSGREEVCSKEAHSGEAVRRNVVLLLLCTTMVLDSFGNERGKSKN